MPRENDLLRACKRKGAIRQNIVPFPFQMAGNGVLVDGDGIDKKLTI